MPKKKFFYYLGQWDGSAGTLSTKPDSVNSIPGAHIIEGKNWLPHIALWPPLVHRGPHVYHTYTQWKCSGQDTVTHLIGLWCVREVFPHELFKTLSGIKYAFSTLCGVSICRFPKKKHIWTYVAYSIHSVRHVQMHRHMHTHAFTHVHEHTCKHTHIFLGRFAERNKDQPIILHRSRQPPEWAVLEELSYLPGAVTASPSRPCGAGVRASAAPSELPWRMSWRGAGSSDPLFVTKF